MRHPHRHRRHRAPRLTGPILVRTAGALPAALVAMLVLMLASCAGAAPAPTDRWTLQGPPRDLPPDIERAEGRRGPNGGTILDPSSTPIEAGVPYRFSLGHCGLASPVDLDGSFWVALDGVSAEGDPIDLATDPEMINATAGVIAVVEDEARFRTDAGSVVRFERHFGAREFPGCD